ncbi:hypothetical protein [Streptomyces sp. BK205]|uniref:hypothetical protein n=1 Tax=Streptomyces sp. BK205 TaxID=2512164 RepID=UPI00104B8400|nr:hypothetical protein [Streptomyces sp. BK205]
MEEDLTSAERLVIAAFPEGATVDLPEDEAQRTIRGELLVNVLTGLFPLPSGARPALKIVGARISGKFILEGLTIDAPIRFEQCLFEEAPNFIDAECPSVRLPACQVPGFLGASLRVGGNLEMNNGFICVGQLDLSSAEIGGDLKMQHALIYSPGTHALFASRIAVSKAFLAAGMVVVGQTRILSGRISGLLSLNGARLLNPDGIALHAERAEVGESFFLQNSFRAEGRTILQNASVGGGIDARGGSFSSTPDKNCLNLHWVRAGRNVSLREAQFAGNVTCQAASIGGSLNLTDAAFASGSTVMLDRLRADRIQMLPAAAPGLLSLRQARVNSFEDDPRSWPLEWRLANFEYTSLDSASPVGPRERLKWLALDADGYRPQPYQQLAAFYRSVGEEQHARQVALKGLRRRRGTLSPIGRVLGYLLDVTVGYGYRTWIAGLWLSLFASLGTVIFAAWPPHLVDPTKPRPFAPFIYTLNLLLPIVDLGQKDTWEPQASTQWIAWTLTLLGWALTTAVVAGISRVLNRST